MRSWILAGAAAVLAAAAPAPATAVTVARLPLPVSAAGARLPSFVTGPLLAGGSVVFGTAQVDAAQPARLFAAPAAGGGPARALPGAEPVVFGAGEGGVLARAEVHVSFGYRGDNGTVSSERLVAGPVDGPMGELSRCPGPAVVTGARVAYFGGGACDAVVVRDVVADAEAARFPRGDPAPYLASGPRIVSSAGFVAWHAGAGLAVGDVVTGAVRTTSWPADADDLALADDGTVAYTTPDHRLILRPLDGPDREIAAWPARWGWTRLLGFSGGAVAIELTLQPSRWENYARVDLVARDGGARTLLRSRPASWTGDPPPPGHYLLGADVEGGRIAWTLQDCDEAVVGAAAIADLPEGGVDATAPERCLRPALDRTTLTLDGRGRGTVAVRCPATCSGRMVLTDTGREGPERFLARRSFALGAGRRRVAIRVGAAARARIAGAKRRRVAGYLTLTGTTGGRPSTRAAAVTVIAGRGA